jgi:GNAT superfamily N-acetyltransferase
MTTATTHISNPIRPSQIRPLNPRRDLNRVADLIELCFKDTLDPDGRNYLKRMRMAGKKNSNQLFERPEFLANMTAEGFVWQENGEIQGNISLIPFSSLRHSIYLIANVAVHPDYRRKGIARALTAAALEQAENRHVRSVWLQVRDNNEPAVRLYESLGFNQRTRRTTWTLLPENLHVQAPSSTRIVQHKRRHWKKQRGWLRQNYPDEILWYWPINPNAFRPGLIGMFLRLIFETQIRQWGVKQGDRLRGVLSWKTTRTYADQLWLAASLGSEDIMLRTLLPHIEWRERAHRPLSIDLPVGRAAHTLQTIGFQPNHTLIWMRK